METFLRFNWLEKEQIKSQGSEKQNRQFPASSLPGAYTDNHKTGLQMTNEQGFINVEGDN